MTFLNEPCNQLQVLVNIALFINYAKLLGSIHLRLRYLVKTCWLMVLTGTYASATDLTLWYQQPAQEWTEALPHRQWPAGSHGLWRTGTGENSL